MLKFGIIGCGLISSAHVQAKEALNNTQLVACCDINEEKAKKFAKANNCMYFTDYRKLISIPAIDIVVIGTPHYLHYKMSIMALENNKHVICEKPMAMTVSEAKLIEEKVQKTHKKYIVCFQNRFNRTFIAAKQIVEHSELGKIRGIKCELTWSRSADYYLSSDWKGKWKTEGGGVLINQAIHMIDAALWMAGTPNRVKGKIYTSILENNIEVEDSAMATLMIKPNIPMIIMATNVFTDNPDPMITLDCSEGQLQVTAKSLSKNGLLVDEQSLVTNGLKPTYWGDGHRLLFKTFCDSLDSNKDNQLIKYLPDEHSIDALKVVKGVYESNSKEKWINL